MNERYLKKKIDLPKLVYRKSAVNQRKLSIDLSLINAPNKNITEIGFPSSRYRDVSASSKSKNYINQRPVSFLNTQILTKSFKKYCSSSIERIKPSGFPMSGYDAMKAMNDSLSEYELRELPNYTEVFFLGDKSCKIHGGLRDLNWGYDDEEANYKVIIGDHIGFRYEILSILGKGSFGHVCKCMDHKNSEIVALKILKNKSKFHKQGEVEIKILKTLSPADHPASYIPIVKYISSFTFRCHICITFELLHISLFEFLKKNHFHGFNMQIIKQISQQLLIALKLMREKSVIHCDLKPENILFTMPGSLSIKVIDFGSGCFDGKQIYTYIQSRFYRAPEVMLGLKYTFAIDMWSFGCILVELFRGFPLFPGKNEEEQMSKIMEIIGVPARSLLEEAPRKLHFFDKFGMALPVLDSKGKIRTPGSLPLRRLIPESECLYNLVHQCLQWDPFSRATPDQALKHKFFMNNS